MRKATFDIHGVSPLSQGDYTKSPKAEKETHDDYEKRTWRERLHTDAKDHVFITSFAIKNCLSEVAKFLALQIPGKGKSTYTKHFESGILVPKNVPIFDDSGKPIVGAEVYGEWLHVPSNGIRGGGRRVAKCFPRIEEWNGSAEVLILDDTVTASVFENHLIQAGQLIGLGRSRVRNNGTYGRFQIDKLEIKDIELAA